MLRVLWFFAKLAVVVAAAVWVANRPGQITLVWLGYRIETTVGVAAVCVLVLIVVAALLYRLWRFLRAAPHRIRHARAEGRRVRGYRALTQGMVAVAAGDPDEARRQQRRADRLLNEPPLTLLLAAQAAQLNGEEDAARRYFVEMLARPDTAFLGVRGLLMQALRTGDTAEALRLATRAHSERPEAPWAAAALLDLQLKAGEWAAAQSTLKEAVRLRAIAAEEARRKRAIIQLELARAAVNDPTGARLEHAAEFAREAVRLEPGFVPARAALVGLLSRLGRSREAARLVEQGWPLQPHPELAAAYASLYPDEAPLDRLRRFERLYDLAPGNKESRLALAEAALDAGLWGTARSHLDAVVAAAADRDAAGLDALPANDPGAGESVPRYAAKAGARACRLMARLEEAEHGNIAAARGWLVAATEAEPDPAWVCTHCGAAEAEWRALCGQCGALDSLHWRSPPRTGVPALGTRHPVLPRPLPPRADGGALTTASPVDAARLVS